MEIKVVNTGTKGLIFDPKFVLIYVYFGILNPSPFQRGDHLYTSEFDVCFHEILRTLLSSEVRPLTCNEILRRN